MAGIPKKVSDAGSSMQTSIAAGSLWMAGIYARLSVDSDDQKNESIDTQIEIAKEYIRRAGDIEYVDRYTDLGRSGTDFEREGFARMMEDVRQKVDSVEGVTSSVVNLVFEPEWDKDMMSEEAKLELGFL